MMRKMPDGGMFPVEPSLFIKEIPTDLVDVRRLMSYDYGGGYGSSGRGGYGGYGSSGRGGYGGGGYHSRPTQTWKTTWRR